MRAQITFGKYLRLGLKLDTRDHLLGVDLLTDRAEDPYRIFTLLVGVPFVSLKLSLRTQPPALEGKR